MRVSACVRENENVQCHISFGFGRDFQKFLSEEFPSVSVAQTRADQSAEQPPTPQSMLSFSSVLSSCTSLHKGKLGGRIMSSVLARACEH